MEATTTRFTVRTEVDYSPESPREWDNLGTLRLSSRRFNVSEGDAPTKGDIILPIRAYEHGSISLKAIPQDSFPGYPFNCQWDSYWIGTISISLQKVRKEFNVKRVSKKLRERVISCLVSEVETYSKYLNGEVYGFIVTDAETGEQVDSCWGFYGEEDALAEGLAVAKAWEENP